MNKIGIMQGRLTPRNMGPGPIQFFPFNNWQNEFTHAKDIGLHEIEFIFDFDRYIENPLWTIEGTNELKRMIRASKVAVKTICADYFMVQPFFRNSKDNISMSKKVLKHLIKTAKKIGAKRVEIPLLDNSSIKTPQEERKVISIFREITPFAKRNAIEINFETDLAPQYLFSFINKLDQKTFFITYDSGNSSSLGYDPQEEVLTYGHRITNIHIKDRLLKGSTVPLGTGDADFHKLFSQLKEKKYKNSFILQAARGDDGKEREHIKEQKNFVIDFINRYL